MYGVYTTYSRLLVLIYKLHVHVGISFYWKSCSYLSPWQVFVQLYIYHEQRDFVYKITKNDLNLARTFFARRIGLVTDNHVRRSLRSRERPPYFGPSSSKSSHSKFIAWISLLQYHMHTIVLYERRKISETTNEYPKTYWYFNIW